MKKAKKRMEKLNKVQHLNLYIKIRLALIYET
jgi:hypothetical protein